MDQGQASETQELILKKKPTFARRVSNMFKDGAKSGPPLLFRHSSMQKIRHCCQNLNLLPYLLYSFDHSKSHPVAVKVNIYLNIVVKHFLQNIILLFAKIQYSILRTLNGRSKSRSEKQKQTSQPVFKLVSQHETHVNLKTKTRDSTPLYLVLAIYLAPLAVACQLVTVCSLLTLSTYTPGFVFLVSALLFLGLISLRIMFHNSVAYRQMKKQKLKAQ